LEVFVLQENKTESRIKRMICFMILK